ncbi:hypothetical protein ANRL2_01245 [Anaerolineae bacterium]|nr:hypothetical protein ANRL2_01245 [Anaerolineae bacterium]
MTTLTARVSAVAIAILVIVSLLHTHLRYVRAMGGDPLPDSSWGGPSLVVTELPEGRK